MVPYALSEILYQAQTKHLSAACLTMHEVSPLASSKKNFSSHDCLELMNSEVQALENVSEDPILNAELVMQHFGSMGHDWMGQRCNYC